MTYEICKECGRFFEKDGKKLCNSCYEKDMEVKKKVKDYVYIHKDVTAIDVIRETGVSIKTLFRYLEEGALEYSTSNNSNEDLIFKKLTTNR
jgi:uncharacterized Zn finger protein (UPF0148 family)